MHTDHLGSVRAVTDEAGTVVWSADYLAFGTMFGEAGDGAFEQWKGFTGKEFDPETGLYYFNARWYDSELDRKSTRLNSSHVRISYAVFCLKKKNTQISKL